MPIVIQKYGGTSVGTPDRIRACADRIARDRARGLSLVVVVSAMGHTTDELIALAHQVSESPPHREMDMLLTAGERISMALLCMALADRGVDAISLTGSQTGIITDSSHRRARIRRILGDRVRSALTEGKVVIVAGFQGVSETKEITTLGRGGSDTTAVALAAVLGAERCEIYTDVDGVFSADPRLVPDARLWRKLPHDLAVELTTRGAGVLNPRSVELARQYGVALCKRSSLHEKEGTQVIARTSKGMEEYQVVGVTTDKERALVTIELMRPAVITTLWEVAAQAHLSIVTPTFDGSTVRFFAEKEAEPDWKKLFQRLIADGFLKDARFDDSWAPVSVVGDRFSQDAAALGEVFDCLAQSQIQVTMGSASALAMTVAVPAQKADDAVQALHRRFFSASNEGKI